MSEVEISAEAQEAHIKAVDALQNNCMLVQFTVYGLPESKRISREATQQLEESTGARHGRVRGIKSLFRSKTPYIANVRKVLDDIKKLQQVYTVPSAGREATDGSMEKMAGMRLIQVKDIEPFEEGLVNLGYALASAVRSLVDNYDTVLAAEKDELGNEFDTNHYPSKDELTSRIRIGTRTYAECRASMRVPPIAQKRLEEELLERANASLDVAVTEVANLVGETMGRLLKQIATTTRIHPKPTHILFAEGWNKAEVVSIKRASEMASLAADEVLIQLRKLEISAAEGSPVTSTFVTREYKTTEAAFKAELCPARTDEGKRVNSETISNMLEVLETFSRAKDVLGPYGQKLDVALDAVRKLTQKNNSMFKEGMTKDEIHREVKNSSTYRDSLQSALTSVITTVSEQVETVTAVRRRIPVESIMRWRENNKAAQ